MFNCASRMRLTCLYAESDQGPLHSFCPASFFDLCTKNGLV